jgi:pimeloyl-ACP methyl ester carboxylesterase
MEHRMSIPPDPTKPATIVLIHGLWLTPRGWEDWIDRYTTLGYRVLAPAWPRMEVGIDALRRHPSVMNGLGITEVADHYEQIIRGMDQPPIIMGHSFGGLLTQILLDRGLGSAGVAIHPAPIKGVLRLPLSSLRSSFPVLRNPATRGRTVALTPAQFRYGFANTLGEEESRLLYNRYHVPAPGRPLWQAATANLIPNPATEVNLHNDNRAPLLLIAGGADHTVPVSLVQETRKRHYKSTAVTDYKEFPGRPHFTMGVPGWEAVADYALRWATKNAVSDPRSTRIPATKS